MNIWWQVLVGRDATLPADEQVCLGPPIPPSSRFITLPFSEHTTLPGTLELLGAINTWLREILGANARLGPRPAPLSIEERNEDSARLMEAADVPQYNWTISATGEEITVTADR